jgi:hypothetical protein
MESRDMTNNQNGELRLTDIPAYLYLAWTMISLITHPVLAISIYFGLGIAFTVALYFLSRKDTKPIFFPWRLIFAWLAGYFYTPIIHWAVRK